jgi:Outer membrane protein beta-barrel domain
MKIKNLIIALCLLNLTTKAQVYFGINAGANMGGIVTKINGTKDKGIKDAMGYIISGDVNIPLSHNLLLKTGLQFESAHSKVNTDGTTTAGGYTVRQIFNAKSALNYINIPVQLFYTIPLGSGSFMAGAGPYMGIGVGGKSSSTDVTERTFGGVTTRSEYNYAAKAKFGSSDTTIKRINTGIGVNVNYVLANNISFSLYTNIGLANLNNENNYNSTIHAYGITVGYVFGKRE